MTSTASPLSASTLMLRLATADDATAVERLAQLDSATVPAGPLLLGLVDERPVAALALDSGVAIADPFVRTADVIAMLHDRAARIGRAHEHAGAARRRRIAGASPRLQALLHC